jgi:hypothetical protein
MSCPIENMLDVRSYVGAAALCSSMLRHPVFWILPLLLIGLIIASGSIPLSLTANLLGWQLNPHPRSIAPILPQGTSMFFPRTLNTPPSFLRGGTGQPVLPMSGRAANSLQAPANHPSRFTTRRAWCCAAPLPCYSKTRDARTGSSESWTRLRPVLSKCPLC